jgi:hypothetical protein
VVSGDCGVTGCWLGRLWCGVVWCGVMGCWLGERGEAGRHPLQKRPSALIPITYPHTIHISIHRLISHKYNLLRTLRQGPVKTQDKSVKARHYTRHAPGRRPSTCCRSWPRRRPWCRAAATACPRWSTCFVLQTNSWHLFRGGLWVDRF